METPNTIPTTTSLGPLYAKLRTRLIKLGFRPAGRLLGDHDGSNCYAMRLHRMTRSPAALGRTQFSFVYSTCILLHVPIS